MKWPTLAVTILILSFASGCVTNKGNYCDIAKAIRPSVLDNLTEDTKRQIVRENKKLEKLCKVRP